MWMNKSTSRVSCNFATLWTLRGPLTKYSKEASLDQLVQPLRKRWERNETSTIIGSMVQSMVVGSITVDCASAAAHLRNRRGNK